MVSAFQNCSKFVNRTHFGKCFIILGHPTKYNVPTFCSGSKEAENMNKLGQTIYSQFYEWIYKHFRYIFMKNYVSELYFLDFRYMLCNCITIFCLDQIHIFYCWSDGKLIINRAIVIRLWKVSIDHLFPQLYQIYLN